MTYFFNDLNQGIAMNNLMMQSSLTNCFNASIMISSAESIVFCPWKTSIILH